MRKIAEILVSIGGALSMLALFGCACHKATGPSIAMGGYTESAPPPAPGVSGSGGCPVIVTEGGKTLGRMAVPTNDPRTSAVLVEKEVPAEVVVGQPFTYTLKVTNLTDCRLDDVVLTEDLKVAGDLELIGSAPQAKLGKDGVASWDLGVLGGKQTRSVSVKAQANSAGEFTHCVKVDYNKNLCITTVAIQPKLRLTKTVPPEVSICDLIPVKMVVSNTGTGLARNVVVTDSLPAGLVSLEGQKRTVSFNVGDLAGGQSRDLSFTAKANRTGEFENKARAVADGGLSADASDKVVVRKPVLAITKTGTERSYVGRPLAYDIVVRNTGDYPATNVTLKDTVPSGTTFVSATAGGAFLADTVTWSLGTIGPGAEKKVGVSLTAAAIGRVTNTATATEACAGSVAATATTVIQGIPAVLLEVIDLEDPIEVGSNETYVITVTNQGSADDRDLVITCRLEDDQRYVSSTGPTTARVSDQTVTFAPLAVLPPGRKAVWNVVVKAHKAGNTRFGVSLDTAELTRPVEETESTNQY